MTGRCACLVIAVVVGLLGGLGPAFGQTRAGDTAEKKEEERKPQTFWDEIRLFSYVENSFTFNLTGAGRGGTNEQRNYDFGEGYTFNVAKLSVKKDPSEQYPFGFGLVVTAGLDAQKDHSLGIFRDKDDQFPFRNTERFDLQEAYVVVAVPLVSGLTIKGGKIWSPTGYEAPDSPSNLNFSQGYLSTLAAPGSHTWGLISYAFTDWLTATAGVVVGWDNVRDNNDRPSYTAQLDVAPLKDFIASLIGVAGPEQNDNNTRQRYLLDLVMAYTGFKNLTLALGADYGHESKEAGLVALDTRRDTDAAWWGVAGYVGYDWTEKLRTSLRQEYFQDTDGARTGFGSMLRLWSTTATLQYKIWKGLVGRLEYRHDSADEKVYKIRVIRPDASLGLAARSKSLDTFSISFYYQFF